jgi:hypothetical protein
MQSTPGVATGPQARTSGTAQAAGGGWIRETDKPENQLDNPHKVQDQMPTKTMPSMVGGYMEQYPDTRPADPVLFDDIEPVYLARLYPGQMRGNFGKMGELAKAAGENAHLQGTYLTPLEGVRPPPHPDEGPQGRKIEDPEKMPDPAKAQPVGAMGAAPQNVGHNQDQPGGRR